VQSSSGSRRRQRLGWRPKPGGGVSVAPGGMSQAGTRSLGVTPRQQARPEAGLYPFNAHFSHYRWLGYDIE